MITDVALKRCFNMKCCPSVSTGCKQNKHACYIVPDMTRHNEYIFIWYDIKIHNYECELINV